MARFPTVLFFFGAFPLLMAAQQPIACEERTLPVNVVDTHGQQILGLTSEQFRADFQGQPVKVMSAKFEGGPQRILMLVDVSGSMWFDAHQRELVKLVADDIVSSGPPQAQLALATFSTKFETIVKFGQGREAVREAILSLNPRAVKTSSTPVASEETAMNDAILEAANMFGSPQPGDVVYAITDGLDNGSKSSTGKVLQYLEQRNIRLFASLIHNGRFMQLSGGPELLGKTAQQTGGYFTILETDSNRKLGLGASTNVVRQLYSLMASFYLLDIKLPKDPDKPWELKLTVVDANGNKKKGTTALHPQNIFPCDVAGKKG
jgi:von Willebrand factor type A domain